MNRGSFTQGNEHITGGTIDTHSFVEGTTYSVRSTPRSIESVVLGVALCRRTLCASTHYHLLRNLYALGTGGSGLPNGWAQYLITTGRVTKTLPQGGQQTLDLGIGNWSNNKVSYRPDHNNHIHHRFSRYRDSP